MAFSNFGNAGGAAAGGAAPSVQLGPDLGDIQTEALGFLALSGESKVQLLSSPWPTDNLPPPTSSLMSVASQKGLLAAAGPDSVVVATTESVRKAFEAPGTGDGNFKPFQPQLRLPMPMRISQLAFSADESYLVLSAEVGGGLAVYETQSLLQGSTQSAFELSTNGQALRALVPNPTPEKGELFAVITVDGNLMMANLKERSFVTGPSGQVLKDGVSCLSWSAKGKQLVAGLGNGTAYQMTPEGSGKGDIPKPPHVDDNSHVSSITWLENHVFLVVHTPSNFANNEAPSSLFHIATRTPPASFVFQKIPEPAGPFGLNRSPPHHFFLRLRDFPPNLQDAIIVASTASTDIGIFSRSKVPLALGKPTGVFAMTEMSDDSRRAQLPMTGDLNDTSPIGIALDLSSKDRVVKPIPSDEMDQSQTPLPALMVLNNEGVLASWWVVYSESVRQGTIYPGLVAAGSAQQPSPAPVRPTTATFGSTPNIAFGAPSNQAAPAPTGAFGAPSGLGQRQSPWSTSSSAAPTTAPAFGSSAFGSAATPSLGKPTFGAPSFGATSTPVFGGGSLSVPKVSPWGSASSTATNTAFGQATTLGKLAGTFGSAAPATGAAPPSTGGFASFASKGGFAAATAPPTGSVFGSKPAPNTFSTPSTNSATGLGPAFGGATQMKPGGLFGGNSSPSNFVLGSTFKADDTAKDQAVETPEESKGSFFGGTFGSALGEVGTSPRAEPSVSKDAEMDSTVDIPKPEETANSVSTTPSSAPAVTKTSPFLPAPTANGGLFGPTSQVPSTAGIKPAAPAGLDFGAPAPVGPNAGGFNFSNLNVPGLKPSAPIAEVQPHPKSPPTPKVKEEPVSDGEETKTPGPRISEPPLPPDPTSKTSYAAGDTSVSSISTDAPLPPDFIPKPAQKPVSPPPLPAAESAGETPVATKTIPASDLPQGPEDEDDDSGFLTEENDGDNSGGLSEEEGSGEDVAKDISPVSETNQTPGFTPQSSFGGLINRGTESSLFTKIQKPGQSKQAGSLFGELDRPAPIFPPPKSPASPRSPSPIRSAIPNRMLRSDASRSVSAPNVASQILGSQRLSTQQAPPAQSTYKLTLEQQKMEEGRRAAAKAAKEAAEKQALIDYEDQEVQTYLAMEIEPTRVLDEFVAHTDYLSPPSMDSIPAQVETVYRDINSMIDTLGLNARALKSFMKGHREFRKEGRNIRNTNDDDEWCLVEVEDLAADVENTLTRELVNSRVKDVATKLEACNELQKDLIRLRARHEDIKRIHASRSDPDQLSVARAQPLSAEQTAQQHDLRRDFLTFQNLLAEAEEGLTILKAKIVSEATSSGKSSATPGPTVEAVMRTITKMTSMAEKRSGDIDVLEGQIRRLQLNPAASVASREGSPFSTPQKNRMSLRNPGTSSTYGLFYTPDSSTKENSRGFQNSLMSSTSSQIRNSPPRKKLSGYTPEEKSEIRTKLARKKKVTDRLREALEKAGTNVQLMDDNDDRSWS